MILTGLLFLVKSIGFQTQAILKKKMVVVVVVGLLVLRFLLHILWS